LNDRSTSLLPGTTGLWNGQLSPDGRHVAALQGKYLGLPRTLVLYNMVTHNAWALAENPDYPHWSADGQYLYFRTDYFHPIANQNEGVYRWRVSTNTVERVALDPKDFRLAGVFGVLSGVTPDGAPLVVKDLSNYDIYKLDLELP
jgi:Tol biopolymer transport system component